MLAEGNQEVTGEMQSKNEFGYFRREGDLMSIRNMGNLNTSLLRILLECSLYLTSKLNDNRHVAPIVYGEQNVKNLPKYFYAQLDSSIKNLAGYMNFSPDECILLVNFIIDQLCKERININPLTVKRNRDNFEKEFCQKVNQILSNEPVDRLIVKFNEILAEEAKNSSKNELINICHDQIDPLPEPESLKFLNESSFWQYRKRITFKSFLNSFNSMQQKEGEAGQIKFGLLNYFLVRINQLKPIKYLPTILKMVRVLNSVFDRQLDKQSASKQTLEEVLENNLALTSKREIIEAGAKCFYRMWTQLSSVISSKLASKITRKLKRANSSTSLMSRSETDLSHKEEENGENETAFLAMPLSSFLPSNTSGEGVFIYALIFYLCEMQNEVLQFFKSSVTPAGDNDVVDLDSLTENDCIKVSVKGDLLNIVYMNSIYTPENNFEYNYSKIQDEVAFKYLNGKRLINSKV